MCAVRPSPFDALQTTFRLLTSGPPLTVDGRCLGHGLPARPSSLRELGALLVHPSATTALQRVVLEELIHRATQDRGGWIIGLAGVATWRPTAGNCSAPLSPSSSAVSSPRSMSRSTCA
jgi:hypothetical protein